MASTHIAFLSIPSDVRGVIDEATLKPLPLVGAATEVVSHWYFARVTVKLEFANTSPGVLKTFAALDTPRRAAAGFLASVRVETGGHFLLSTVEELPSVPPNPAAAVSSYSVDVPWKVHGGQTVLLTSVFFIPISLTGADSVSLTIPRELIPKTTHPGSFDSDGIATSEEAAWASRYRIPAVQRLPASVSVHGHGTLFSAAVSGTLRASVPGTAFEKMSDPRQYDFRYETRDGMDRLPRDFEIFADTVADSDQLTVRGVIEDAPFVEDRHRVALTIACAPRLGAAPAESDVGGLTDPNVEISVLVDCSGSMAPHMDRVRTALAELISALPQSVFVNVGPSLATPFSWRFLNRRVPIRTQLPGSSGRLYHAVGEAYLVPAVEGHARVILLVSDGAEDRHAILMAELAAANAHTTRVAVASLGNHAHLFDKLAHVSEGMHVHADEGMPLAEALAKLLLVPTLCGVCVSFTYDASEEKPSVALCVEHPRSEPLHSPPLHFFFLKRLFVGCSSHRQRQQNVAAAVMLVPHVRHRPRKRESTQMSQTERLIQLQHLGLHTPRPAPLDLSSERDRAVSFNFRRRSCAVSSAPTQPRQSAETAHRRSGPVAVTRRFSELLSSSSSTPRRGSHTPRSQGFSSGSARRAAPPSTPCPTLRDLSAHRKLRVIERASAVEVEVSKADAPPPQPRVADAPSSGSTNASSSSHSFRGPTPEKTLALARLSFFGVRGYPPPSMAEELYATALRGFTTVEVSRCSASTISAEQRGAASAAEFRSTVADVIQIVTASVDGDGSGRRPSRGGRSSDPEERLPGLVRRLNSLGESIAVCFAPVEGAAAAGGGSPPYLAAAADAFRAHALCWRSSVPTAAIALAATAIRNGGKYLKSPVLYTAAAAAVSSTPLLASVDSGLADAALLRLLPKCIWAARTCHSETDDACAKAVRQLEMVLTLRAELSLAAQHRDATRVLHAVDPVRLHATTAATDRWVSFGDAASGTIFLSSVYAHLLLTAAEMIAEIVGVSRSGEQSITTTASHLMDWCAHIDTLAGEAEVLLLLKFIVRSSEEVVTPRALVLRARTCFTLAPGADSTVARVTEARRAVELSGPNLLSLATPLISIESDTADPGLCNNQCAAWMRSMGLPVHHVRASSATVDRRKGTFVDVVGCHELGSSFAPWRLVGDIAVHVANAVVRADHCTSMLLTAAMHHRFGLAAAGPRHHPMTCSTLSDVRAATTRQLLCILGLGVAQHSNINHNDSGGGEECRVMPSVESIGKAYRREALRWHPDTLTGLSAAAPSQEEREYAKERFTLLCRVYEELLRRG